MKVKAKDKSQGGYRLLLVVPILLLLVSAVFLINKYQQTGERFSRSIELKGGMLISLRTSQPVDISDLESKLSAEFGPVSVRKTRGLGGNGLMIETEEDANPDDFLDFLKKNGIETKDVSIETIGPALGESFWRQAQLGIITAFILMGIIVFLIFRTFVPSVAVIFAAFSDIFVTMALMQVFNIDLTLAGLAALLMLIGYSVDTDILLTTRVLKTHENDVKERIRSAFKTGITMTGTTLAALSALYISSISPVLSQIAAVLLIGLFIDIINTWLMNSVILRWYIESRRIS